MKRSKDWSGNVQQVYNNFTIMGALNLDFIEILIILSSSVQLPVVTCNKIIIAIHICNNSHDMRAIRGVSGSETRSTDRLPRPTETRGQMLNFTAEAGSNPGDK